MTFRLTLLGAPGLTQAGAPIPINRRQARAVLYYLAAQTRPVSRDSLLALLWPELDRSASQQTLRTLLHSLRRAVGDLLLSDDQGLSLSPAFSVDLRDLQHALTARTPAELAPGLALYRGEFLDGFSLAGSPAFDSWLTTERERIRRQVIAGLGRLSQWRADAGDLSEALAALDQALGLDPLQEDLQRRALQLQYAAGDRAGAIRRYDQMRRLLDEELGVPPMAETRAAYDAILSDSPRAHPPSPQRLPRSATEPDPAAGTLPFVGRADALAGIQQGIDAGALVVVEGEAGVGKTRLIEHWLKQRPTTLVLGAGRELEQGIPYHPLVDALRASERWPGLVIDLAPIWREELARLLPELDGQRAPAAATNEGRVQEALLQCLLVATSGAGQRVLVVDDLHWADRATLALLAYLVRRTRQMQTPLAILVTTRPFQPADELGQLVQTLTREGRMQRLRLGPLERAEVEALSQHISPAFAFPLAAWLTTQSEGNPYVIAELVSMLREHHVLQGAMLNPAALPNAPTLPPSVQGLILNRLTSLSEPGRRLLEAAVIIGREFDFDIAQRASALSEGEALDALDELQRARLVAAKDGPGLCRVDHALTVEVVRREMTEPRHRHLHRRTAATLEQLGRANDAAYAAVIATHLHDAGEIERAAPYAAQAAERAGRVAAWREAVRFYEQAVAGTRDRERKAALLRALGRARLEAGQAARAEQAFQEALALAVNEGQRAMVQLELAQSLLQQSRFGDAVALAQTLLEQPTPDTLTRATAELLWGTALSVEGSDLQSADEHLARADALIGTIGQAHPEMCAQVRFERGSIAAQQGDLPRALEHYQQALAVADEAAIPVWATLAHNNIAYHALLSGDLDAAQTHVAAGLRLAEERGLLSLRAYLLSTQAEIALHLGRFEAAEALLEEGLALAEQLGMRERIAGLTANLGLIAVRRQQPALAIHRLSTALAQADAIGTLHLAAQIRIWLAPLLPAPERQARLAEARAIAASGGRGRLLEQLNTLDDSG